MNYYISIDQDNISIRIFTKSGPNLCVEVKDGEFVEVKDQVDDSDLCLLDTLCDEIKEMLFWFLNFKNHSNYEIISHINKMIECLFDLNEIDSFVVEIDIYLERLETISYLIEIAK